MKLSLILCGILNTRFSQCFLALHAGTAFSAVLLTTLVAAPGLGIVNTEFLADGCNLALGDVGIRSHHANIYEGARLGSLIDCLDKFRATVRIDGVVAAMIGDEHLLQIVALSDTDGDTEGKVFNCMNLGEVNADINAGGITGAMARENDLDPEDDTKTSGSSSLNVTYKTRIVVRDCINKGAVNVKKKGGGGIVGSMDMGSVLQSYNFGNLESDDADYVGGIAGQSKSIIRRSAADWRTGSLTWKRSRNSSSSPPPRLRYLAIRDCSSSSKLAPGSAVMQKKRSSAPFFPDHSSRSGTFAVMMTSRPFTGTARN